MNTKTSEEIRSFCKVLRLNTIAENFEDMSKEAAGYNDYLHMLLEREVVNRSEKAVQSRIRNAKFPYKKFIEDLEIKELPIGMQRRLPELMTLNFIENGQNVILTGNPGTGKTHCAIGLGIKACEAGYKVLFTSVPYLVTELKECTAAKTLRAYQRRFEKYDLVIADELGYISFDREGADLLFSNLSLRTRGKSTLLTSNLQFEQWIDVFGDAVITAAMVDRLTYKAILIDMTGESYRYKETLRANGGILPTDSML